MFLIDRLAEERIQQSLKRGELNDLPGNGRALNLDDNRHVPEDLRAAYRLLKNAGFVPPEIQCRREIADIESALSQAMNDEQAKRARKRLLVLRMQLERKGSRVNGIWSEAAYRDRLLTKLAD